MTIIGIDPGKNGAVAWIRDGDACVEKMPETVWDLHDLLKDIACEGECFAYLEKVHSSPGMGVVSAFTFGNGFGHLEMGLTACGIPFEKVRPQVWQKAMGCMTKGDKNVSKRRAQELFPTQRITHAIADALLIAAYGQNEQKQ